MRGLTYPELEYILVVGLDKITGKDDGCLQIAEEYAALDGRFKIIACPAAGVSDARNRGLDAAKGEYIGFVDGDDYVEPGMYDRLYDNMISFNADVSVIGKYDEYPDESTVGTPGVGKPPELLTSKEAVQMLMNGSGFFFHGWDKLFKAELFEGIRFPEDKYVEDRYVVGEIMLKAERIIYDRTPLYHFRVSSDSFSRHKKISEMNSEADTVFAARVLTKYPELCDETENYLLYGHITCLQNALMSGEFNREEEKVHFDYIREHEKNAGRNPFVSKNTRIKTFLSLRCLPLLKFITLRAKRRQDSVTKFTKT